MVIASPIQRRARVDIPSATNTNPPVDLQGNAYEFTLATTLTGANFDAPASFNILVFEEGGVLTPTSMVINGELLFSIANKGREQRARSDTTCTYSFETEQGVFSFVVMGLLNLQ